jgi:hypothetical protein
MLQFSLSHAFRGLGSRTASSGNTRARKEATWCLVATPCARKRACNCLLVTRNTRIELCCADLRTKRTAVLVRRQSLLLRRSILRRTSIVGWSLYTQEVARRSPAWRESTLVAPKSKSFAGASNAAYLPSATALLRMFDAV